MIYQLYFFLEERYKAHTHHDGRRNGTSHVSCGGYYTANLRERSQSSRRNTAYTSPHPASPQAKGFPQAKGSAAGTHPGSVPATHPSPAPATHPSTAPATHPSTGPHPASPQAKGFPQAKGSAAGTHPGSAPATHPSPATATRPGSAPATTPVPRQPPTTAPRQPPPQRERPNAAKERPSSTDQDGAMERLIGLFLAGDITPETYVNGIKALTETPPTPAPIPPPRRRRASCRRRAQQAEETPSEQPIPPPPTPPPPPQAKDSPSFTQHWRAAPQAKDSPSSTQQGRATLQAKDSPEPAAVGVSPDSLDHWDIPAQMGDECASRPPQQCRPKGFLGGRAAANSDQARE